MKTIKLLMLSIIVISLLSSFLVSSSLESSDLTLDNYENWGYPIVDEPLEDSSDILTEELPLPSSTVERKTKIIHHRRKTSNATKRDQGRTILHPRSTTHTVNASTDTMKPRQHVVISSGKYSVAETHYYLDDTKSSFPVVGDRVKVFQEFTREMDMPFDSPPADPGTTNDQTINVYEVESMPESSESTEESDLPLTLAAITGSNQNETISIFDQLKGLVI